MSNQLKEGDPCPSCNCSFLKRKIGKQTFSYKRRKLVVENYITYKCSYCEEAFTDAAQIKTLEPKFKELQGRK